MTQQERLERLNEMQKIVVELEKRAKKLDAQEQDIAEADAPDTAPDLYDDMTDDSDGDEEDNVKKAYNVSSSSGRKLPMTHRFEAFLQRTALPEAFQGRLLPKFVAVNTRKCLQAISGVAFKEMLSNRDRL